MIKPGKIKPSEVAHILELIEQQTRAEIMSRFGRFDNLEFADYFRIKLDKESELREYVFGSSDLVVLGERWGILPEQIPERRERKVKVVSEKKEQTKYEKCVHYLMKVRKRLPNSDARQVKIFTNRVKVGTFFSEKDRMVLRDIYFRYKRKRERK